MEKINAMNKVAFLAFAVSIIIAASCHDKAKGQQDKASTKASKTQGIRFPGFQAHLVDSLPNGYQVKVADINNDGKPDIIGLSTSPSSLEWYENPGWQKHVIATQTGNNITLAAYDIDQDGWTDIALASDFDLGKTGNKGLVSWVENPGENGIIWKQHKIGEVANSHRLLWADVDGDGISELVDAPIVGKNAQAPDYNTPARLTLFKIPPKPSEGQWPTILIDSTLTVIHGICIADWNGDGLDDILTASFQGVNLFLSQKGSQPLSWKKSLLFPGDQRADHPRGSSEIGVGQFNGSRFLATIEPWHGNQVVVYAEGREGWQRQVLDDQFVNGHGLVTADLDGDGSEEIIAGFRGKGASLLAWRCLDDSLKHWQKINVDIGDMATSCVQTADIDQDGRMDIIAIGSSTDNIKWYKNQPAAALPSK